MSKTVGENADYSKFEREFIDTLNKHAPKKTKLFRGNQKPHVNKVLRSAIIKRSRLKNEVNKTRKALDIFNYKKQRNLVVKINNECKTEYLMFDVFIFDVKNILFWFRTNSLKTNAGKIQFIILNRKNQRKQRMVINSITVKESNEVILLGITINN